jgi:hypothetical protein
VIFSGTGGGWFLQGFLGKKVCRTWFFDGGLLVGCGALDGVFRALKICHFFEVYF